MIKTNNGITLGFALCGSFCTFSDAIRQMRELKEHGYEILPIMSTTAFSTSTRFGKAESFRETIRKICGCEIIHTLTGAEPIGPKKLLDVLLIEPCTGNTAAKLAGGVTDTPVTLAAKAHLRNGRPVVLGLATNDALSAAAANIGRLLNTKNIYFIPMGQDSCEKKPRSVICDFSLTEKAVESALAGRQLQPIFTRAKADTE